MSTVCRPHGPKLGRGVAWLAVASLVVACGSTPPATSSPGGSTPPTTAPAAPVVPTPAVSAAPPTHTPAAAPAAQSTTVPPAGSTPKPVVLAPGSLAITISDNLVVRSKPRVASDSKIYRPYLRTGTRLRIVDGPVSASGYRWYRVEPAPPATGCGEELAGWVAAAARDGTPWIAPAPAETAAATSTPRPTARPVSLAVSWHKPASATPAVDGWTTLPYSQVRPPVWTQLAGRYVMAVDTADPEIRPEIWISPDALRWTRASVAAEHPEGEDVWVTVEAVSIGGPGLVARGEVGGSDWSAPVLWTSTDGLAWDQVAGDAGLSPGQRWLLDQAAYGDVVFVGGAADVTRYGGPPFDATALDLSDQALSSFHVVVDTDGTVTVFRKADDLTHPIGIWRASGTEAWHKIGTIAKSQQSLVWRVAVMPKRWILLASSASWTSSDGVAWKPGAGPDTIINDLIVDATGFIAVGERMTGTGCAVADWEIYGETWTSVDGRSWQKMPDTPGFNRASIQRLMLKDRTLVGLGLAWTEEAVPVSTVWTATLP
jgi:hypothetical protein